LKEGANDIGIPLSIFGVQIKPASLEERGTTVGASPVWFHFASVVTMSWCILISKERRSSGLMECTTIAFERISVPLTSVGPEFQLTQGAFTTRDVIANLAEILCLDQFALRSGMAIDVPDFNDLPFCWQRVTLRYPTMPMKRWRSPSNRYTAIERRPSLTFFAGLGPTINEAVVTTCT
jgi:hypothetical protein